MHRLSSQASRKAPDSVPVSGAGTTSPSSFWELGNFKRCYWADLAVHRNLQSEQNPLTFYWNVFCFPAQWKKYIIEWKQHWMNGFHCNALIFRYMILEKVVTISGTHLFIFEKNELMMIISLPSYRLLLIKWIFLLVLCNLFQTGFKRHEESKKVHYYQYLKCII